MAKQRRINIQKRTVGGKTKYTALYYLPDGSSRSAGTFTNKQKATSAAEVAWDKSRKHDWVDPQAGKATLDAYVENVWMPNLVVEVKTAKDYACTYRVHIKPFFGDRPLTSILPSDIETWLNGMETREPKPVSRTVQAHAHTIFGLIMRKARRDRLITYVPLDDVKPRPVPRPEVKIFSPEQWSKFIEAVPERYRLLLEVSIATGLRASELRPLSPAQIKWGRQKILVDRALVQVNEPGMKFAAKPYPKGKRSREVSCDRRVLRLLAQEIMRLGLQKDSEEPIFLINGEPFTNEFSSGLFKAAREKAGITDNLTLKHLRSSRASWLLKETEGDLARVQKELGHGDIQTTQKYLAVVEIGGPDEEESFEDYLKEDEG